MGKKIISILALLVLAVCLISGGCKADGEHALKSWKDLLNVNPIEDIPSVGDIDFNFDLAEEEPNSPTMQESEMIAVDLYFISPDGSKLTKEVRSIVKEEGLARSTIGELIKGPAKLENLSVFPEGTKLLDINIKPEGNCIVDFSPELTAISNGSQEKLAVYALVNTLAQFDSVKDVQILINGDRVNKLAGHINVSGPIEPDFSI